MTNTASRQFPNALSHGRKFPIPLLLTLASVALVGGCGTTGTGNRSAVSHVYEGPVAETCSRAPDVGCAGDGEFAQVTKVGGLRVRPDHVVEDSRCPINAWCTAAGRLVLRATVLSRRGSSEVDLTLGIPVKVADGTVTLVSVTPERLAGQYEKTPKPYHFTIAFARL
jgi:hypothetical protein